MFYLAIMDKTLKPKNKITTSLYKYDYANIMKKINSRHFSSFFWGGRGGPYFFSFRPARFDENHVSKKIKH